MRTDYYEAYLAHYGVKGMKWGVRKDRDRSPSTRSQKKEAKQLKKAQKAYDKNVRKNWYKAYNNAADYATRVLIPEMDKKYTPAMLVDKKVYAKYAAEYNKKFEQIYQQEYNKMFGSRPS